MKSRYVNTKFWADPFIGSLDPLEKLLFLYFLTNDHTNIAGIYELDIRVMEFESGISAQTILEILIKFQAKILYFEGYVIIKNFYRHQTKNVKINIGISCILKELPPKIINKLAEIDFPVIALRDRGDADKASIAERYRERTGRGGEFSHATD